MEFEIKSIVLGIVSESNGLKWRVSRLRWAGMLAKEGGYSNK